MSEWHKTFTKLFFLFTYCVFIITRFSLNTILSDSTEAHFVEKSPQLSQTLISGKSAIEIGESQLHFQILALNSISSLIILESVMFLMVIGFSSCDRIYFDLCKWVY